MLAAKPEEQRHRQQPDDHGRESNHHQIGAEKSKRSGEKPDESAFATEVVGVVEPEVPLRRCSDRVFRVEDLVMLQAGRSRFEHPHPKEGGCDQN